MLVMTRRMGESLIIGENEINITVLGINGNQVRIGIDAPEFVSVHRKEIYQRIQAEEKMCPGMMLEYSPQKKRFISGFLTPAKPAETGLRTAT